jgi:arsenate reductase (thioredoxin)
MTGRDDKPAVLFLCTGNSARSQMAEALLRQLAGDRFEAHSAGLQPSAVHPLTREVMNEIGVDMSGHRSKGVEEFLGKLTRGFVVFVCDRAETSCPATWPGLVTRLSWPFDDPAACRGTGEERIQKFREVRDEIEERIKQWLEDEFPV